MVHQRVPIFHPRPLKGTSEWLGGSKSAGESSSMDWLGSLGLRRYSSCNDEEDVRRMFRRMSLSSFNARLMYLGSEVNGTTTYGLNGRDLSRWIGNSLTRWIWLFIPISHCAQIAQLHGIENWEQKIMMWKFCDSIIQSLFRQWCKRSHIWQSTLISILRSPSTNPHRVGMNQISLCISWSTP